MKYEDVQTLLLNLITPPSKKNAPGIEPLFGIAQDSNQLIIHHLLLETKPRFTPATLFRHKDLEDKQTIKLFMLLLAIEHPEHFNNIDPHCLYMRILNTQRQAHTTAQPGKTKSSRDFQWIMQTINNQPSTIEITPSQHKPIVNKSKQTQADQPADFIFQRAITLINHDNHTTAAYRVLDFLIHLHNEQRFTKAYPTLELMSEAFLLLATRDLIGYISTSLPSLLTSYLNHIIRADSLSPKQDMANIMACLTDPHKQTIISQHIDARLLFSRLYHLVPLSKQRSILLNWLSNKALFSEHFPELDLQLLLLTSNKGKITLNEQHHFSPLSHHCIGYLFASDDGEREQIKSALIAHASPEGYCLRLQIQLIERENELQVPLEKLGNSDTAKRLQISLNYMASIHTKHKIMKCKNRDENDPHIETLTDLYEALQTVVIDIIKALTAISSTPTLSQIKATITLLINMPDRADTDELLALARQLLTRSDVVLHYENTAEYQSLLGNLLYHCDESAEACDALAKAIHLQPLESGHYYDYAIAAEDLDDFNAAAQASQDCLNAAYNHIFPGPDTCPIISKQIMKIVFSNNLPWLHKHFPDQAGLMHRGALFHWHATEHSLSPSLRSSTVKNIKIFYRDYPYETFKTLTEGWPPSYEKYRFDVLLTLAKTINKWRCYKVLFLNLDFIATKSDSDIYKLINSLNEDRLLKRALKLALDPNTALGKKLENYSAHLKSLHKSMNQTYESASSFNLFQPFDESASQSSEAAHRFHQQF